MWTMTHSRARTSGLRRTPARAVARLGELFDGYLDPGRPHAGAYDEMFGADASVRSAYRALYDSIAPSRVAELTAAHLGRARP
jgi:hypothetical protein